MTTKEEIAYIDAIDRRARAIEDAKARIAEHELWIITWKNDIIMLNRWLNDARRS